jgi:hypothetical protein
LVWDIREPVSGSVQALWDIEEAVSNAVELVWDVAELPGVLTIVGGDFYLDGLILNPGSPAEGKLMNVRLVQATVDFSGETEVSNWDADANTTAFIAQLPNYKAKGVNAITVSFQGGNFNAGWDEAYDAGAWNADGTVKAAHWARMELVIAAMIDNGIVPIVGLTYFRQDQILTDEAAVLNMVEVAKGLLGPYKDRIIVEVTNESENALVSHAILQQTRNHEIVDDLVLDGFFASASHHSGTVPSVAEQGDGQVVLLHSNGETVAGIGTMIASSLATFPTLPAVVNEDGDSARTATDHEQRAIATVNAGGSWGYHEPLGYQYWDGTNMTTIDWSITGGVNAAIKAATFDEILALTTPSAPLEVAVPTSIVTNEGWDDPDGVVTGADLYTLVDEGIAGADDDTTRLRSPASPTNDVIEFHVTDLADPGTGLGHYVRARVRSASTGGVHDVVVALIENTTVIASGSFNFDGTSVVWQTLEVALTETEANSITDYNDLRIRITANQTSGLSRRVQLTAAEFEIASALSPVATSIDLLWDQGASLAVGLMLEWGVNDEVADSVSLVWDVVVGVESEKVLVWGVFVTVTNSAMGSWDVREVVADAVMLEWDVRGEVSEVVGLVWDVGEVVANLVEVFWNVLAGITDAVELAWDVESIAGVTDAVAMVWDVGEPITDATVLRWNVTQELQDEVVLHWDAREAISDTASLLWAVSEQISDDSSIIWDVEATGAVTDTLNLLWSVEEEITDSLTLNWNVRVEVADDITITWDVLDQVEQDVNLIWDVEATDPVQDSVDVLWGVAGEITDALALVWDVHDEVGDVVELTWDTFVSATTSTSLLWAVTGAITDSISLRWDVTGTDTISTVIGGREYVASTREHIAEARTYNTATRTH